VFVSIVMPVRNEEKYIGGVLDSVVVNDFPRNMLEILVVDGMSDDRTIEIASDYAKRYPFVRVIENRRKNAAAAMNIGIEASSGDVVIRLDAHAIYPRDYISKLVKALDELNADNVGACVETLPADDSSKARSIAMIMSHPFGVGNSAFRTASPAMKPFKVDTVPFGCYRRDVFSRVGGFDEDLIRNQDNEFNERLSKAGGSIYLLPSLRVGYYARESFVKLWRMFYQYGYFGPLVDIKLQQRTQLRRYVPLIFVLSMVFPLVLSVFGPAWIWLSLCSLGAYSLCAVFFSLRLGSKARDWRVGLYSFVAFGCAHISYGVGHLMGVWDFFVRRKHLSGAVQVELSR